MLQSESMKTSSERLDEFAARIEQTEIFDMETSKYDISEHVFAVMERQGVSKAKLARRLGKSRAYVTKILQGNANFTLESLVKIARALDCRLDVTRVLIPIHQAAPMFDWALAQKTTVRVKKAERDYIKLVAPLVVPPISDKCKEKEKDNESIATAA